ncbi:protein kinase, putative, partial [Entamoeba invadens IP1]
TKYDLSIDKLSCFKHQNKTLSIALPVVITVIIMIVLIITIFVVCLFYKSHKSKKILQKTTCEFSMKKSNINFIEYSPGVTLNKTSLDFSVDFDTICSLPIDKPSRDLLCVGNNSKHTVKVQLTYKTTSEKYTIRVTPSLATLSSGKAVEFEIFVTPLCTCSISETIAIVLLNMSKGEQMSLNFPIKFESEKSSHLDAEEVICEKKIGEGSFGVVYIGNYIGNKVAIKKMKEVEHNEESMEEFEKEVQMLDKFRSEFVVHFYGAVFARNKVCMVTEFATYGSLQDLMKHKTSNEIDMKLRVKICLDAAKGISYLHENGILHRDIKPDNILVFSLETIEKVNAKLTDFGSSRNVNLLMTNMTFTKGIGTPTYMAPEVLKKEKYKMSADIFSFGVTIYECVGWCEAYPKDEFKFPWKIAEFVISGKRVNKNPSMSDNIFNIISECWKQDMNNRPKIEDVVHTLEVC